MIPVITTEYKLVLVGDSAVGSLCLTQASLPFCASLLTENLMINYSLLLESTSNSAK